MTLPNDTFKVESEMSSCQDSLYCHECGRVVDFECYSFELASSLNGNNGEWTNTDDVKGFITHNIRGGSAVNTERKRMNKESKTTRHKKADTGARKPVSDGERHLCRLFMAGNCSYGIGCKFSHNPLVHKCSDTCPCKVKTISPTLGLITAIQGNSPKVVDKDCESKCSYEPRDSSKSGSPPEIVIHIPTPKEEEDPDPWKLRQGTLYYTTGKSWWWILAVVYWLIVSGFGVLLLPEVHTPLLAELRTGSTLRGSTPVKPPSNIDLRDTEVYLRFAFVVYWFIALFVYRRFFHGPNSIVYRLVMKLGSSHFNGTQYVVDHRIVTVFNLQRLAYGVEFDGDEYNCREEIVYSLVMYDTLLRKHPAIRVNINTTSTLVQTLLNEYPLIDHDLSNIVQQTALLYVQERRRQLSREKQSIGSVGGFPIA